VITREEYDRARGAARQLILKSGIAVRDEELAKLDVVDFGLGEIDKSGLQVMPIAETPALGVRLVALLPGQTCPQHRHPPLGDHPGKEETWRVAWGKLYVNMPGEPTREPQARPPAHRAAAFTVRSETVLQAGDQLTSAPNTWHWFQAGPEGAVVWLFCSRFTDAEDEFTDPDVRRMDPVLKDAEVMNDE
jgi:D-lyxose ketol-isomerase